MKSEVTVAELEPRLVVAERLGGLACVPGLPAAAPAAPFVVEAGERVYQAVEVGRDVEAVELVVVADVADHGHRLGPDHVDQAADETGAADAT